MKIGSDCSGECCVCWCGDKGCIAGHGDDDYMPATKEQVIDRLDSGRYPRYREEMKEYLYRCFSFIYKEKV